MIPGKLWPFFPNGLPCHLNEVATISEHMTSESSAKAGKGPQVTWQEVRFYGGFHGVGGDPSNFASSRSMAARCTSDENRSLVLRKVQAMRTGSYQPCDVGVAFTKRRILDVSVRVCRHAFASAWLHDNPSLRLQALTLVNRSGLKVDLGTVSFSDCEVLKYVPGGFFAAHVDRRRDKNHLGTLGLMVCTEDAEGGSLLCHVDGIADDVGNGVTPTLVFIPLGVSHSVDALTAGKRYVAKASVYGSVVKTGSTDGTADAEEWFSPKTD